MNVLILGANGMLGPYVVSKAACIGEPLVLPSAEAIIAKIVRTNKPLATIVIR